MEEEISDNPFEFGSFLFNGIYFPEDGTTAEIRGTIGGESQALYAGLFRKDEQLTIVLTFEADPEMATEGFETAASFSVNNQSFESVDFGQETNDGKTWSGLIPRSGVYIISVVAHPVADYTLKVTRE
jgi:hypothetical protein